MEDAHSKNADEVSVMYAGSAQTHNVQVLRHFGTGQEGLTEDQVERLRAKYGANGESERVR